MKKFLALAAGALLALFLTGCPQDDDSFDGSPKGHNDRTLKISNQTTGYMWHVNWASLEFDDFFANEPSYMESPSSWPEGYHGQGLPMGSSVTQPVVESGTSSYVYFNLTVNNPAASPPIFTYSVRTQELVLVDDEPVEFKINDNTIVIRTDGTSYQGPLSGLSEE
jgi:hypothetical protein